MDSHRSLSRREMDSCLRRNDRTGPCRPPVLSFPPPTKAFGDKPPAGYMQGQASRNRGNIGRAEREISGRVPVCRQDRPEVLQQRASLFTLAGLTLLGRALRYRTTGNPPTKKGRLRSQPINTGKRFIQPVGNEDRSYSFTGRWPLSLQGRGLTCTTSIFQA